MAARKTKAPEFTTWTEAVRFLKKGRGDKTRRATADGWNTTAVSGPNGVELCYEGNPIATFRPSGQIEVDRGFATLFPARERLNRYVFTPRNLEISPSGTIYGKSEVLLRGNVAVPVRLTSPGLTALTIDSTGAVMGAVPVPIPLSPTEWGTRVKEYVSRLAGQTFSLNSCYMCASDSVSLLTAGQWNSNLGEILRDPEHLYAHIISGEYPGELILRGLLFTSGWTWLKDKLSFDATSITFQEQINKANMQRGLRYYLTHRI